MDKNINNYIIFIYIMKKFSIRNNLVLHAKTTTLQEPSFFLRTNKKIPFQFAKPPVTNALAAKPLVAKPPVTNHLVAKTLMPPNSLKQTYSVVLLNYARPQNIPLVLKSLIESEFITDIIISNGNLKTAIKYAHPKVLIFDDSSINESHGLDRRFLRMLDCKSENVIVIDDDIIIEKSNLTKVLREYEKDTRRIVGIFGRTVGSAQNNFNYIGKNVFEEVPIVLTKLLICKRTLADLFFYCKPLVEPVYKKGVPYGNGEDIFFSFITSLYYNKPNYAVRNIVIKDLGDDAVAVCKHANHGSYRSNLCKFLFSNEALFKNHVKEFKSPLLEEKEIKIEILKENNMPNRDQVSSFNSSAYWDGRYKKGGNSGAGSYNALAQFKAFIINKFIKDNNVQSLIDFGVGDGNQLSLLDTSKIMYYGVDISPTAITKCKQLFHTNKTKQFFVTKDFPKTILADLVMSCDVLYHLIENSVYYTYLHELFNRSTQFVIIYARDEDLNHAVHVKFRKFTDYIKQTFPNFKLIQHIPNKFPQLEIGQNNNTTSPSDFYVYKKQVLLSEQ